MKVESLTPLHITEPTGRIRKLVKSTQRLENHTNISFEYSTQIFFIIKRAEDPFKTFIISFCNDMSNWKHSMLIEKSFAVTSEKDSNQYRYET